MADDAEKRAKAVVDGELWLVRDVVADGTGEERPCDRVSREELTSLIAAQIREATERAVADLRAQVARVLDAVLPTAAELLSRYGGGHGMTATDIARADVVYLWHWGYWDGPLSGACEWRGERFAFVCVNDDYRPAIGEDGDPRRDEDGDPELESVRTFHLVRLTPEEWAREDARHALFRECVGTHTDYDRVTQRRTTGHTVRPQSDWKRYHDAYPASADPAAIPLRDRPAVARYEA